MTDVVALMVILLSILFVIFLFQQYMRLLQKVGLSATKRRIRNGKINNKTLRKHYERTKKAKDNKVGAIILLACLTKHT